MNQKSNTHSTVHVVHNLGSPTKELKETLKQKKKKILLCPIMPFVNLQIILRVIQKDYTRKWQFVPPFEMRISHPQCNCSDQLKTCISFLHCVGPFQLTFCLANFQMSNHKCSLTRSASRHHIHPFMVDSKSEKGSKPSPLPKCFVWKLELSAKAPGTLLTQKHFLHITKM